MLAKLRAAQALTATPRSQNSVVDRVSHPTGQRHPVADARQNRERLRGERAVRVDVLLGEQDRDPFAGELGLSDEAARAALADEGAEGR